MMKKLIVVLFVVVISQLGLSAQESNNKNTIVVKGTVFEIINNEKVALPFANVFIENTEMVTTTDFDGRFVIEANENRNNLKCTFRGYKAFFKEIDSQGVKFIELNILMIPENTSAINKVVVNNS